MNTSDGTDTEPNVLMRILPSLFFYSIFIIRVI